MLCQKLFLLLLEREWAATATNFSFTVSARRRSTFTHTTSNFSFAIHHRLQVSSAGVRSTHRLGHRRRYRLFPEDRRVILIPCRERHIATGNGDEDVRRGPAHLTGLCRVPFAPGPESAATGGQGQIEGRCAPLSLVHV